MRVKKRKVRYYVYIRDDEKDTLPDPVLSLLFEFADGYRLTADGCWYRFSAYFWSLFSDVLYSWPKHPPLTPSAN